MCICVCVYVCMYIYIYIERERQRDYHDYLCIIIIIVSSSSSSSSSSSRSWYAIPVSVKKDSSEEEDIREDKCCPLCLHAEDNISERRNQGVKSGFCHRVRGPRLALKGVFYFQRRRYKPPQTPNPELQSSCPIFLPRLSLLNLFLLNIIPTKIIPAKIA